MSLFDRLLADFAAQPILEICGTAEVTCTPPGGQAVTLTAVAEPELVRELESDEGKTEIRTRVFKVRTDPASAFGGIAAPVRGLRVAIAGLTYSTIEIEGPAGGFWILTTTRGEIAERSRRNYRVNRSRERSA